MNRLFPGRTRAWPVLFVLVVLFVWMWLREKRRADRVDQSHRIEAKSEMGAAG